MKTVLVLLPDEKMSEALSVLLEDKFDGHLINCFQVVDFVDIVDHALASKKKLDAVFLWLQHNEKAKDYWAKIFRPRIDQLECDIHLYYDYDHGPKDHRPDYVEDTLNVFPLKMSDFSVCAQSIIDQYSSLSNNSNASVELPTNSSLESYERVSFENLRKFEYYPCAIFIKIEKKGDLSFIKRFSADTKVEIEDLQKYQQTGLDGLYIESIHKDFFTHNLSKSLQDNLGALKKITDQSKKQIVANQLQFLIEKALIEQNIDSNEVEQAVTQGIDLLQEDIKNQVLVSELASDVLENRLSFSYQYTRLTSQVVGWTYLHLVKQKHFSITNPKQIEDQLRSLIYCSYFCDINLKSKELRLINSHQDLLNSSLDEEKKEQVLHHAVRSMEIVRELGIKDASFALGLQLIKEHQAQHSGVGFYTEIESLKVFKLSLLYAFCDDFVKRVLANDPRLEQKEKWLEETRSYYHSDTFTPYYLGLKKYLTILDRVKI